MPSFIIRGWCEDNESMLALLEQLHLNAAHYHVDYNNHDEQLDELDDPEQRLGEGDEPDSAATTASSASNDMGARFIECTADPDECTDPFCDHTTGRFIPDGPDDAEHPLICSWCGFETPYDDEMEAHIAERHVEGVIAAQRAVADTQNAKDIGLISETIANAFMALIEHNGYNAWSCKDQAHDFVLVQWGSLPEASVRSFDMLPNGSKPWWLVVLWAIQDWHARGVDLPSAQSMLRGIEADVRGMVTS